MRTRRIGKRLGGPAGVAIGAALIVLGSARSSFAQDLAAAANAFSRAQKAELAGDHDSAAELYELADSLAPTPEAVRSALRARKAAGQLGSAALEAEKLIQRYPDDKRSKELADATLEEAKHKLMRLEVKCVPKACGIILDAAAANADTNTQHVIYAEPGEHRVVATFGTDRTDPQTVQGKAGDRPSLTFNAPPERKMVGRPLGAGGLLSTGGGSERDRGAPIAGGSGLPIWVFATGAIITVGVGAVAIWSGVDVLQAHTAYEHDVQNASLLAPGALTKEYNNGKSLELRTNVLVGATIVAGASTTVIALFTRWIPREAQIGQIGGARITATAGASSSGGRLMLNGSF
jgi:hypothetical protein